MIKSSQLSPDQTEPTTGSGVAGPHLDSTTEATGTF